ncbi:GNAT family N-acetyltransferase [Rhodococcus sp. NPDC059234]|uniref:GNAT family N-acetyltransferase n=1 Tax=Rhodococcus sp. NPDC059234 TaxID=3346781 RepID=UPI003672D8EB
MSPQSSPRSGAPRSLAHARLGPRTVLGHTLVLRHPEFADFADWRRIRLRDRQSIEPFWETSPLDWDERHSEKLWVRECLARRESSRAGRDLSMAIEVDGRFAGQCNLGSIDPRTGSAEMGIWVDTEVARHGIGGLAVTMILDYGFDTLGLRRVTAPICTENVAATRGAPLVGYRREAVMAEYLDVGGRHKDHALWAVTRDCIPPNGFATRWIGRYEDEHSTGSARTSSGVPQPNTPRHGLGVPRTAGALLATAGYYAGRLRRPRSARPMRTPPVQLESPARPGLRVHTRSPSDSAARREMHPRDPGALHLDSDSRPAAWGRPHTPVHWLREYLREHREPHTRTALVLEIEVDDRFAGRCGFCRLDMFARNAEMFVWADSGPGDRYVGPVTIELLLDYAFGPFGLNRVSMAIEPDQDRAADILTRVGMVREGTLHDYVDPRGRLGQYDLWAITASVAATHH